MVPDNFAMEEQPEDLLCLSGRSQTISRREDKRTAPPELVRKERPKTAVRKMSHSKTGGAGRPSSAMVTNRPLSARMPDPKTARGRGRGLMKSVGSIDSGLSPQNSGQDSSEEEERETEEERRESSDEEESVDSGIIKVTTSNYEDMDDDDVESGEDDGEEKGDFEGMEKDIDEKSDRRKKYHEAQAESDPQTLVKEFDRIEDDQDADSDVEQDISEELDDDVDAGNGGVVFTGHHKKQSSKYMENQVTKLEENKNKNYRNTNEEMDRRSPSLKLTDVEPHEHGGILAAGSRRSSVQEDKDWLYNASQYVEPSEKIPSYEKRMEVVMSRLEEEEKKTYDISSYQNKITDAKEEDTIVEKSMRQVEEQVKKEYEVASYKVKEEEPSLGDRELEELKQKCLARGARREAKPIISNPPDIKDFSNSQKLMNFLDQTEEKDKNTMNAVKRSTYTAQVTLSWCPILPPVPPVDGRPRQPAQSQRTADQVCGGAQRGGHHAQTGAGDGEKVQ